MQNKTAHADIRLAMGMSNLDAKRAEEAVRLVKEHIQAGTTIPHSFTGLIIANDDARKEMNVASSNRNYLGARKCVDIINAKNEIIQLTEACLKAHTYLKKKELQFCRLQQFLEWCERNKVIMLYVRRLSCVGIKLVVLQ